MSDRCPAHDDIVRSTADAAAVSRQVLAQVGVLVGRVEAMIEGDGPPRVALRLQALEECQAHHASLLATIAETARDTAAAVAEVQRQQAEQAEGRGRRWDLGTKLLVALVGMLSAGLTTALGHIWR